MEHSNPFHHFWCMKPDQIHAEETMTTNNYSRKRFAAGTCLTLLMAFAAPGQENHHPIPTAPKKSYEPASVRALPGLQCRLYAERSDPFKGLRVFTDDDGYAPFHAVPVSANAPVQRLTLDCKDSEAAPSTFSVDLTSDQTFEPRPLDIANERGTDRPALTGDPLSYSQSELIQAG